MKRILLILILVMTILALLGIYGYQENFSASFVPYQDPYFGYCTADLTKDQWKSGNFTNHCWNNYAYEDCELLNQNNYNCGFNLKTGEKLKCVHKLGKCKEDNMCFSTCYQQVGEGKEPYMIQVTRDNLIGLSA